MPTDALAAATRGGRALAGATVVLSGVFDGFDGFGLHQGKGGVRALVTEHGGKVVGSISKKSTFLVVGASPGASKVCKAVSLKVPVVGIDGLMQVIAGGSVSDAERAEIADFSTGFNEANGWSLRMTNAQKDELRAAAAGVKRPAAARVEQLALPSHPGVPVFFAVVPVAVSEVSVADAEAYEEELALAEAAAAAEADAAIDAAIKELEDAAAAASAADVGA